MAAQNGTLLQLFSETDASDAFYLTPFFIGDLLTFPMRKRSLAHSSNNVFYGAVERTGGFDLDRGQRCSEFERVFGGMIQPSG